MELSWVATLCAFAVAVPIIFIVFFPDQSFYVSIAWSGGFTLAACIGWCFEIDPYLFWLQPILCTAALSVTLLQVGILIGSLKAE